ncbi:MAG: IS1182 family transposase [Deltaproteobacteria bacterium]|nr:IS1182 family transposase [Deltaproteobacteria bacterium]
MMGHQPPPQPSLFYTGFNLDQRIRKNHPLRKIDNLIDFEFIYQEVRDKYGSNGNISVAPPIILKLMLLLVLYNVRSERELMGTLPERLDWLWFLGYNLDSKIPNHSVLSKARKKWGVETFKSFFERIVWQCVEVGLVDGKKIFVDSSLIDADASNNSVVDTHSLKKHLKKGYPELEKRLSDREEDPPTAGKSTQEVNQRYVSTTDPEASIVKRGTPRLGYQTHRAVDPVAEIITAIEVTPGHVNEAHRMISLLDTHQENTRVQADTIVADSKYGTIQNLLACKDRGVAPHMPTLRKKHANSSSREGIFPDHCFAYQEETNTYRCPAGKTLIPRTVNKKRQSRDYKAARKDCTACVLRPQCTRSKTGRTVKRHLRHDDLIEMLAVTESSPSQKDIKTRQHLMERSFANGKPYEFDRARWRGLWRVGIQEYLTAAIQNIQKLIKYGKSPLKQGAKAMLIAQSKKGTSLLPAPFLIPVRAEEKGLWKANLQEQ